MQNPIRAPGLTVPGCRSRRCREGRQSQSDSVSKVRRDCQIVSGSINTDRFLTFCHRPSRFDAEDGVTDAGSLACRRSEKWVVFRQVPE